MDQDVFQATVERSIGIEKPSATYEPAFECNEFRRAGGHSNAAFLLPSAKAPVVVLTDGESQPVAVERLRSVFLASPTIATVFVQFWDRDERVFTGNAPEAGYRPDPSARTVLDGLAAAMQARVYDENELGAVRSDVRDRVGSGPTVPMASEEAASPRAVLCGAALAPLFLVLWRRDR